eukprot:Amastigsp_a845766_106.p1 type:complete len:359 gc:universal Amastigsp_a845766_106:118-1194(+)
MKRSSEDAGVDDGMERTAAKRGKGVSGDAVPRTFSSDVRRMRQISASRSTGLPQEPATPKFLDPEIALLARDAAFACAALVPRLHALERNAEFMTVLDDIVSKDSSRLCSSIKNSTAATAPSKELPLLDVEMHFASCKSLLGNTSTAFDISRTFGRWRGQGELMMMYLSAAENTMRSISAHLDAFESAAARATEELLLAAHEKAEQFLRLQSSLLAYNSSCVVNATIAFKQRLVLPLDVSTMTAQTSFMLHLIALYLHESGSGILSMHADATCAQFTNPFNGKTRRIHLKDGAHEKMATGNIHQALRESVFIDDVLWHQASLESALQHDADNKGKTSFAPLLRKLGELLPGQDLADGN